MNKTEHYLTKKQKKKHINFQVTFDSDTVVSGITTKGRADAANWVTSFTLQYSADGTVYQPIQEAGADVVSA